MSNLFSCLISSEEIKLFSLLHLCRFEAMHAIFAQNYARKYLCKFYAMITLLSMLFYIPLQWKMYRTCK